MKVSLNVNNRRSDCTTLLIDVELSKQELTEKEVQDIKDEVEDLMYKIIKNK